MNEEKWYYSWIVYAVALAGALVGAWSNFPTALVMAFIGLIIGLFIRWNGGGE